MWHALRIVQAIGVHSGRGDLWQKLRIRIECAAQLAELMAAWFLMPDTDLHADGEASLHDNAVATKLSLVCVVEQRVVINGLVEFIDVGPTSDMCIACQLQRWEALLLVHREGRWLRGKGACC